MATWIDPQDLLLEATFERVVTAPAGLTQAIFVARCLAVAAGLRSRGVQRAVLAFDDAGELAVALYACWRADVVAVLAPPGAMDTGLAAWSRDADIWLSDHEPGAGVLVARLSAVALAVGLPPCRLDFNQGGVVLCTSGSSGAPKTLLKSWAELAAEVQALKHCDAHWRLADDACVIGSVSAQHMYGLPFRVLWPLCAGHPIVGAQQLYPEDLLRATLAVDRAVWVASPALLSRLGGLFEWQGLRGRVTHIFSAGGALPPGLADVLSAGSGARVIDIYGSSETGVVAWRQCAGLWRAFPGVTLAWRPDNGLLVRSPWTAGRLTPTGDAARGTADTFELIGRLDRIVKLEEKRIALPGLERQLLTHEWVNACHIAKVDADRRLGAIVALSASGVAQLRRVGRRALVETLRRHLAADCDPIAVPRTWRLTSDLPVNPQGKLTHDSVARAMGPRPVEPEVSDWTVVGEPSSPAWQCCVRVPEDLACLAGHFPTAPVVPGVVLVGWAMNLACVAIGRDLVFGGVDALKFQRLLRPAETAFLRLRWEDERAWVRFDYTVDGRPCAVGRIVCRAAGAPPIPASPSVCSTDRHAP